MAAVRSGTSVTLLGLGLACAFPGAALAQSAGPRLSYFHFDFTTAHRGASSGIHARILYRHPSDPNRKPIPVRREIFTYPAGTGVDPTVVPACRASQQELRQRGEGACPRASRVLGGNGTAMSGLPLFDPSATEVDGFENGTGLSLLATVPAFGARFTARGVRDGPRRFVVNFPRAPGGPPDGESAIRRVDNLASPRSLGNRAYMRTPEVCPRSGYWTFHGEFLFADGGVQTAISRSPCIPDVSRPRIRIGGVPRRRCASRAFRVRVTVSDESRLRRVHLRLYRRIIRRTTRTRFSRRVSVRRLKPGRHRLSVIARDIAGNRARDTVRFRRCAAAAAQRPMTRRAPRFTG